MTHADRDGSERELTAYLAADKAEPAPDADRVTAFARLAAENHLRAEAAERALADERAKVAGAWDEGYRFGRIQQFDADHVDAPKWPTHNSRASLVKNLDYLTGACHDNPYRGALAGDA